MKTVHRREVVKGLGLGTATLLAGCNLTMKSISFSASADASGKVSMFIAVDDRVPIRHIQLFDTANPNTPLTDIMATPWEWSTSNVPVGKHTYFAKVFDDAGNSISSAPSTVEVIAGTGGGGGGTADITPPTISLAASSTSVTAAGSITLNATATDNIGVAKVEFWEGNTRLGISTASPFTQTIPFTSADNGSHTYTAVGFDAANNTVNSSVSVTVNIAAADTTPPTVSLASDSNNVTASGNITLTATATDNNAVTKVEFWDDLPTAKLMATISAAPFVLPVTLTGAENGNHNYTAKAFDAAGNTTTSTPVKVTVNISSSDTTPPTVSLASSSTNVTTASSITLNATATDNIGVAKVEFWENSTLLGTINTAPYTQSVPYTSANNGTHTYTAVAYDAAGNSANSSVTVTVNIVVTDTTAPTVSLASTSTSVTAAGSITLNASATDNIGVSKVEFIENGAVIATSTASPYSTNISFAAANNGTHTYTAKAYDAAGNVTTSNSVTVTVNIGVPDTTAPTVSLASTSTSVTAAGSITLTATATDNVGVSKVEFYEGTTLLATKTTSPYTNSITFAAANNGTHTYTAKAYDAAGNVTTSNSVTVTVNIAATTGTKIADYTQLASVGSFVSFTNGTKKLFLYRSATLQPGGISANGMFFVAYYIACTHQGTNVGTPNASTHIMVCPNHGAQFNAETGTFTSPATKMLATLVLKSDATSIYY